MDELRAAAERLRRYGHGDTRVYEKPLEPHENDRDRLERDRAYLVSAYLAEHPADDGEPITDDWLRAVGWTEIGDSHWIATIEQGVDHSLDGPEPWHLSLEIDLSNGEAHTSTEGDDGHCFTTPLKTRADIRRLAAVFRIPLTEPA